MRLIKLGFETFLKACETFQSDEGLKFSSISFSIGWMKTMKTKIDFILFNKNKFKNK